MWILAINGEGNITAQGALHELDRHQNTRVKSKVCISLIVMKSYQKTDLEEICSVSDQFRPVISHLEFRISNKPPTPKNIGEGLKCPHGKLWK